MQDISVILICQIAKFWIKIYWKFYPWVIPYKLGILWQLIIKTIWRIKFGSRRISLINSHVNNSPTFLYHFWRLQPIWNHPLEGKIYALDDLDKRLDLDLKNIVRVLFVKACKILWVRQKLASFLSYDATLICRH